MMGITGGKATVWIIGGSNGASTNTLNAYDGETGALLYKVLVMMSHRL